MNRLNPRTFSSLVYFEACARLLSFSEAADELCITTGAISQQIRKLEEQLDLILFKRHPRGIELSPAGEELFATMHPSIEAIKSAIERIQSTPDDNHIVLRSTPSFVYKYLIPKLVEFQLAFPHIKVETHADASLLELKEDNFDLAIDFSEGKYREFDAQLLSNEIITPVASPTYLKKGDWSDPDILSKVTLLHDGQPWQDAAQDAEWRYWLDQSGLTDIDSDRGHYFNRSDMAIAAADAGLGVAIARHTLVKEELESGRLITPFAAIPSCCNYYILSAKNGLEKTSVDICREWLLHNI